MDWNEPGEPVDEASFREALEAVVGTAHENGVSVERDWACRSETVPDWNVDVVRLAERDGDERGREDA